MEVTAQNFRILPELRRRAVLDALIEAHRSGGPHAAFAMEQLYSLTDGIRADASRKFCGPHDPEEVRQEADCAFCEAVRAYDPEKGAAFSTFLFRFIVWKLSAWAKRQPLPCLSLDCPIEKDGGNGPEGGITLCDLLEGPYSASDGPEEAAVQAELREAVAGVLDGLKPNQRSVIEARYLRGEALKDIAAARRVTKQAVQDQERRALSMIRKRSGEKLRPLLSSVDSMRYSSGIQGTGTGAFNRTWTSATERTALMVAEGSA